MHHQAMFEALLDEVMALDPEVDRHQYEESWRWAADRGFDDAARDHLRRLVGAIRGYRSADKEASLVALVYMRAVFSELPRYWDVFNGSCDEAARLLSYVVLERIDVRSALTRKLVIPTAAMELAPEASRRGQELLRMELLDRSGLLIADELFLRWRAGGMTLPEASVCVEKLREKFIQTLQSLPPDPDVFAALSVVQSARFAFDPDDDL